MKQRVSGLWAKRGLRVDVMQAGRCIISGATIASHPRKLWGRTWFVELEHFKRPVAISDLRRHVEPEGRGLGWSEITDDLRRVLPRPIVRTVQRIGSKGARVGWCSDCCDGAVIVVVPDPTRKHKLGAEGWSWSETRGLNWVWCSGEDPMPNPIDARPCAHARG